MRAVASERRGAAYARPIIPGTVLYESFAGNGALDNPEAIFRELLRAPERQQLRHVWVLDRHAGAPFRAEFRGDHRVRFVRYRSARYFAALARSQYLINNATFPPEFQKREGQTYLNTWHGTPLKTMGYDMPDGAAQSANTLRNFVSADVLLAQNPTMTRMYRESYKLDGIFRGRILETGYPRTDRQTISASERETAHAALRSAGIALDGRTLIVYAPTWKGSSFTSPRDDAEAMVAVVDAMQQRLGDKFVVVLKAHQAVHRMVADHGAGRLIPNDLPTNVVLGLTDVLVTDYSSIFFDFLSTGRPIVFFTPDEDDYAEERGTSELGQLPGRVTRTLDELAAAVLADPDPVIVERAEQWRREFTPADDGNASGRVVDAVFNPDAVAITGSAPGIRSPLVASLPRRDAVQRDHHLGPEPARAPRPRAPRRLDPDRATARTRAAGQRRADRPPGAPVPPGGRGERAQGVHDRDPSARTVRPALAERASLGQPPLVIRMAARAGRRAIRRGDGLQRIQPAVDAADLALPPGTSRDLAAQRYGGRSPSKGGRAADGCGTHSRQCSRSTGSSTG